MLDTANPVRTDTHAQRKATVDRLTALSIRNKTNPFLDIAWPESLPEDVMWMPHKLMTVHGTQAGATLTPEQLLRLSKWESIWFYSFNVHGERHLLRDVLNCMHSPGYEDVSDYMHHFVCEENNHSWFFSNFCTRYGGKVYVDKRSQFQAQPLKPAANAFLIFARILILEEMLDYYNVIIAADEAVPAVIRELNALHHYEEARHMAFGRAIVADLFDKARKIARTRISMSAAPTWIAISAGAWTRCITRPCTGTPASPTLINSAMPSWPIRAGNPITTP